MKKIIKGVLGFTLFVFLFGVVQVYKHVQRLEIRKSYTERVAPKVSEKQQLFNDLQQGFKQFKDLKLPNQIAKIEGKIVGNTVFLIYTVKKEYATHFYIPTEQWSRPNTANLLNKAKELGFDVSYKYWEENYGGLLFEFYFRNGELIKQ